MIDTVKKTLLAGLGAALITKEAVENALHDWIEKGKITPGEAKTFAEKLVTTGTGQWEKSKDDVSQKISDIVQKAPFARRADLSALEARVALLEQIALRVGLAGGAAAAPESRPSTEA
jgi:polyhydroxyalkanoate synthesis regulator phasin